MKLSELLRAVIAGKTSIVSRLLAANPELARAQVRTGATRQHASEYFFESIAHYAYAGDTALHMAAAAFERQAAELLVRSGADCRAKNRRGAEPLHYAADANRWKPDAQKDTIEFLIAAGPIRTPSTRAAYRHCTAPCGTRSSEAVRALLAGGAAVRSRNGSGSTPLHLAVQDTGRGGAGSVRARSEQETIIAILLEAGARSTDRDGKGRSVLDASSSERIRMLLTKAG
jgi:hypothetical protein